MIKNSKLVQLLTTFNTKDWRRFHDFVSTPFFNKKKELIPYVEYLKKLAPDFPSEKITSLAIYNSLFPKKPFNQKHLNHLNNYLLMLAENYIGWSAIEQQPGLLNRFALGVLTDKKLAKHFSHKFKKTTKLLEEKGGVNFNFQLERYLIFDIASQEFDGRQTREYNPFLQAASDQLDNFYFFHKLKYCCSMLAWQSFISVDYSTPFLEEIKQYLVNNDQISPEVNIYLKILQLLLVDKPEPYFYQLIALFESDLHILPRIEQKEIYFHAINFCARKIREGEKKYLPEALSLYENGIEQEILFENGYLSPWTYGNVVKLGLSLKKYDWTKSFIFQNKEKISLRFRENAFAYNVSELYYYTKDYDKAMGFLTLVKFEDVYHLSTRVILIKIYYETDAQISLVSLIASFLIFLKRNKKISSGIKKTYQNFCEILHQVLRKDRRKREVLKEKIENIPLLTDRSWLLTVLEKEIPQ